MHNKDDYAIHHVIDNHDFQLKTVKLHASIFNLNILQLQTAGSAMPISKICHPECHLLLQSMHNDFYYKKYSVCFYTATLSQTNITENSVILQ